MRVAALCLVSVAVVAGCGGSGTETVATLPETVATLPETVATVPETVGEAESVPPVIPEPVEATRAELLVAAESGDYERLRPLVPEQFSYTFGGDAEGGALAYWQQLEEEGGVSPIAILADLLKLPPTYYGGSYVWPFAFPLAENELTPSDRELLRGVGGEDLSDDFLPDGGYLGWRVGIEPDGDWIFFIAGD